jgi:hypothetical protein
MYSSTRRVSIKLSEAEYHLPEMPSQYFNASAAEAMRTLREGATISARAVLPNLVVSLKNAGPVRYRFKGIQGHLLPDSDHLPLPEQDRMRVLRRRVVGVSSPLFADWNALLPTILRQVSTKSDTVVHNFGVGRGAIARAVTSLSLSCIGYDLRATFPVVAQRDSSYLPPELIYSPGIDKFSWSRHTRRTDGDVFLGELDISTSDTDSLAIIDLDLPVLRVLEFCKMLPVTTKKIIRVKGSSQDIKYAISTVRPENVYSLATVDDMPRDVILVSHGNVALGEGNYDDVEILKAAELSYSYPSNELLEQLWNTAPRIARIMELDVEDNFASIGKKMKQLQNTRRSEVQQDDLFIWEHLRDAESTSSDVGRTLRIRAILMNIIDLSE